MIKTDYYKIIQRLQSFDGTFHELFNLAYKEAEWTETKAAEYLKTSIPVIKNWLDGTSAPYLSVQRTVLEYCADYLLYRLL